jgi:hypothetical protein
MSTRATEALRPSESDEAMQFLSSGSGAPAAKFPTVGTKVAGEIVEVLPERQARQYKRNAEDPDVPKTFPNGDPVMETPIIVQLDDGFTPLRESDTGRRGFYCQQGSGLFKAIAEAARKVGEEPKPGAYLEVEFVAEVPGKGSVPKKVYSAKLHPEGTWENSSSDDAEEAPTGGGFLGAAPVDDDALTENFEKIMASGPSKVADTPAPPAKRGKARPASTPPKGFGLF